MSAESSCEGMIITEEGITLVGQGHHVPSEGKASQGSAPRAANWLKMSQIGMKCWKEVFLPWPR